MSSGDGNNEYSCRCAWYIDVWEYRNCDKNNIIVECHPSQSESYNKIAFGEYRSITSLSRMNPEDSGPRQHHLWPPFFPNFIAYSTRQYLCTVLGAACGAQALRAIRSLDCVNSARIHDVCVCVCMWWTHVCVAVIFSIDCSYECECFVMSVNGM